MFIIIYLRYKVTKFPSRGFAPGRVFYELICFASSFPFNGNLTFNQLNCFILAEDIVDDQFT